MLSSVLNSPMAVQVNIQIMRTFAKLRKIMTQHKDLAWKMDELEKKYDTQFKVVFDAIRQLMTPPEPRRKHIGFKTGEKELQKNKMIYIDSSYNAGNDNFVCPDRFSENRE